jgi:hypothetical protein
MWIATADPETLRAAVVRLAARVAALEWERTALIFAAESFGALADRLNDSLRASAKRRAANFASRLDRRDVVNEAEPC